MENLERPANPDIRTIAETFERQKRELSDREQLVYIKRKEIRMFYEDNLPLILERLRKIISPHLTKNDLRFGIEGGFDILGEGDDISITVEVISVAGNTPDNGLLPADVSMPEASKIKQKVHDSLKDLGLFAMLHHEFFPK